MFCKDFQIWSPPGVSGFQTGRAEGSADQQPPNEGHITTELLTLHPDQVDTQMDRDTQMDSDTQLLSNEVKVNIGGHNALPPLTILSVRWVLPLKGTTDWGWGVGCLSTEIYFLTVLEAGSSSSRYRRVGFFWGLSHWFVEDSLLPHLVSPLYVSKFLFIRTLLMLDWTHHNDFILTLPLPRPLSLSRVTLWGTLGLDYNVWIWGGHIHPVTPSKGTSQEPTYFVQLSVTLLGSQTSSVLVCANSRQTS